MRVMSYNLRMDTPKDGQLAWTHRIPAVQSVWGRVGADVVCIQEGLPHQVQGLAEWFPNYAWVGRGRNEDGGGECVAIFYRRDEWTCLEHGDFWLSDTPDQPGSRSFGNRIPRISTWARLVDRADRRWFILNTHLDHESEEARRKGAAMIAEFIADRAQGDPLIVTGDLNALPQSEPLRRLLGDGHLVDVFDLKGRTEGTFHNYSGQATGRIDYILSGPGVHASSAEVVKDQPLGIWPSDHYPIYADVTVDRA